MPRRENSNYSWKLLTTLGNFAFTELGTPTGIYWSPDRSIFAVSSIFDPYHWVGKYLLTSIYQRVCVYKSIDLSLCGVFDEAYKSINDITIHPNNEIIIIGSGEYDGGYFYEGDLWRWDINSGEWASIFEYNMGVLKCSFDKLGQNLDVTYCYEKHNDEQGNETYGEFIVNTFTLTPEQWQNHNKSLSGQELTFTELGRFESLYDYNADSRILEDLISELNTIAKNGGVEYEPRWQVRDLVWTNKTGLLVVRNNTALEQGCNPKI